jgi:hypothetical protein
MKAVAVALVIGVLICSAWIWARRESNPSLNAERSRIRIEKTIDARELQLWATNLLKRYSSVPEFGGFFPVTTQIPEGLDKIWKKRQPEIILRDGLKGADRYVCIAWGSGMLGRWGLAVGSTNFVLLPGMEADPSEKPPSAWKPGIYFFQHYH